MEGEPEAGVSLAGSSGWSWREERRARGGRAVKVSEEARVFCTGCEARSPEGRDAAARRPEGLPVVCCVCVSSISATFWSSLQQR